MSFASSKASRVPKHGAGAPWIASARKTYAFDMASAVRGALKDLKLDKGRVAFDDMGFAMHVHRGANMHRDGVDHIAGPKVGRGGRLDNEMFFAVSDGLVIGEVQELNARMRHF